MQNGESAAAGGRIGCGSPAERLRGCSFGLGFYLSIASHRMEELATGECLRLLEELKDSFYLPVPNDEKDCG